VDRLARYRAKRDFDVTPEPAGEPAADGGSRFVVQRHRARALHYDFRLEMDGVLVSWAVPKGPTLDAAIKRMAVHVEDHPVDYYDFEGVIPRGEYGGGDVIVWDWGTWTLVDGSVARGDLHFSLDGIKLRGRFALLRRGTEQWLLIHKRDAESVSGWNPEDYPRSVKSGLTNDEIAQ
jgi:bifunctional non-homologous end joining protein LigD